MVDFKIEEIEKYLSFLYNDNVTDIKLNELGSGCVGTGHSLDFTINGERKRKILKTLFTSNLGMDHFSDRAGSLLLAHSHYKKIPRHIQSVDVCGVLEEGSMISIGKAKEFFILMDEAKGEDMFDDFARMAKEERLSEKDRKRILELSDYLVQLHKEKSEDNKESLYKRCLRGVVGGNTSIMSIVDMYPKNQAWICEYELQQMIKESVKFWSEHKFNSSRLCQVHGDFHPGNIWYNEEDEFTLLDRSGMTFGEAADDLTPFSINFIFYSFKENGALVGACKEGFNLFWQNYLDKSQDENILNVAAPFFALRSMVVINPIFYDDFFGSKDRANKIRRDIFYLALRMLEKGKFDFDF